MTGGGGGSEVARSHRKPGAARRCSPSAAVGERARPLPDLGLLASRTNCESAAPGFKPPSVWSAAPGN